jgi:plastocyanin
MGRMKKTLSLLLVLAALGVTLAAVTASGAAPRAHAARTKVVKLVDDAFKPKRVTIHKGSTIKWVWRGQNQHNVHVGRHHSGLKVHGSYKHKFTHRGTFRVVCSIHVDLGMTMKVRVIK